MKETVWVEINGKRTGAVLDRKEKKIYVDRPSKDFDHVVATDIDGEFFTISYHNPPEPRAYNNGCVCGSCDPSVGYPYCC